MGHLLGSAILTGLLLGAVYAVVGVGMSLIYGVLRVVNFAHGDFIVLAAFLAWTLHSNWGWDPLRSLIVIVPAFFVLGLIVYKLLVPRLLRSDDPETASFLAFFGISLMLGYLMVTIFGATPRGIPYPYEAWLPAALPIGPWFMSSSRIIAALVVAAVIGALIWFLFYTFPGKAVRSLIQNREAAAILGIPSGRISALSFGLGLALVGAAGVLVSLAFPSIAPRLGANYTVIAFSVIVLGGMRSPTGAMAGGLLFGLAESVAGAFLPTGLSPAVAFFVLIVTVMVRPEGLLTGIRLFRRQPSTAKVDQA